MHTLYMIYDESNKVTDFVIDNVSTTQNFISLDRGPLSYIQSIIDNLNAYIKKNGSLTVDNGYLGEIRHGHFDTTYGEIEDKQTENSQYTFHVNIQPASQPAKPQQSQQSTSTPQSKPSEPAPAASSTAAPASSTPSK